MTHNIKPTTKAPAKQSKKDQRQQARARRRQLTGLAMSVVGLAVLALLGFGAWNLLRPKPGQSVALQARTHIQVSDSHEPYDTNPPHRVHTPEQSRPTFMTWPRGMRT